MATIRLEIVTPEKKVVDREVDVVTVPTENGEVGILYNHAPLISTIRPGVVSYTVGGATEKLLIAGGFVEVSENRVSVLADVAETPEDINIEAAKSERDQQEKVLGSWSGSVEDFQTEKEKLLRAQARIQFAGTK